MAARVWVSRGLCRGYEYLGVYAILLTEVFDIASSQDQNSKTISFTFHLWKVCEMFETCILYAWNLYAVKEGQS